MTKLEAIFNMYIDVNSVIIHILVKKHTEIKPTCIDF